MTRTLSMVLMIVLAPLLALLLAGCGDEGGSGGNAPGEPTATPQPTPAPTIGTLLPPTWTPVGDEPGAAPQSETSGAAQSPALTLPPTWTPRPPSVPAFAPGPSPTRPPDQPTWTPLPDWCDELHLIAAPGISYTRLPVVISWAPVPDVPYYRVELRNPVGGLLVSEVVRETEYTFPGDLFATANVYGWQITPLDESGQPTCYALADEIVVRAAPS